jgi:hypothetical protein
MVKAARRSDRWFRFEIRQLVKEKGDNLVWASLPAEPSFLHSILQAVSSVEEARLMKAAGADAIWVKREALQPAKGEGVGKDRAQALLVDLADAMTGDD